MRLEVGHGLGLRHGPGREQLGEQALAQHLEPDVLAVLLAQAIFGGVLLAQLLAELGLAAQLLDLLIDLLIHRAAHFVVAHRQALALGLGHDQLVVDQLLQHLAAQRVHHRGIRLLLRAREQHVELLLDVALEDRFLVHDRGDPVHVLRVRPRREARGEEGRQRRPSQHLQGKSLHGWRAARNSRAGRREVAPVWRPPLAAPRIVQCRSERGSISLPLQASNFGAGVAGAQVRAGAALVPRWSCARAAAVAAPPYWPI
jgi:hypothetical protein